MFEKRQRARYSVVAGIVVKEIVQWLMSFLPHAK
jgi:hypothetical protein